MNTQAERGDLYSDQSDDIALGTAARVGVMEIELAAMRDRWMRAEAETANVRARAKRDVEETRQYAVQKFASDIAEATENLRRGLDSIPPATGPESAMIAQLRDGFAGIERNFVAVLDRHGIKRVDPTGGAIRSGVSAGSG